VECLNIKLKIKIVARLFFCYNINGDYYEINFWNNK